MLYVFLGRVSSQLGLVARGGYRNFIYLFYVTRVGARRGSYFKVRYYFPGLFKIRLAGAFMSLGFNFALDLDRGLIALGIQVHVFVLFTL